MFEIFEVDIDGVEPNVAPLGGHRRYWLQIINLDHKFKLSLLNCLFPTLPPVVFGYFFFCVMLWTFDGEVTSLPKLAVVKVFWS